MSKGLKIDFNIDGGHNQINFPQFIYSGLSENSVNDLCVCSSGMTINGSFTGQTCELSGLDDLTESIYLKITCEGCEDQTFLVAYPTPTPTPTLTPTLTQTITPTLTQSITPTLTPTLTQTLTPTQSITPTQTITPTINVTETITPTITPTLTETITPTLTETITPTLTLTPTITPTVIDECCVLTVNTEASLNIPITGVEVEGVPVTYSTGTNFPINPTGGTGYFYTFTTGSTQQVIVYYGNNISGQQIQLTDCAETTQCCDINPGGGYCVFDNVQLACGCSWTITGYDGSCF